jgi:hypothetical protein
MGVPDFAASVDDLDVHEHVGLARLVSGSVGRYSLRHSTALR